MRYPLPLVPGKALRSVNLGIRMNRAPTAVATPADAVVPTWQSLVFDSFGGTDDLPDHVADTGQALLDDAGFFGTSLPTDWSTRGGWLGSDVASHFGALYDVDFGVVDQFVHARLRATEASADAIVLGLRYEEGGFGYTVELNALTGDALILDLWRYAPGGTTLLLTTDPITIDPTGFEVSLIACAAQQRLLVDGVLAADTEDAEVTIVGKPLLVLSQAGDAQRADFGIDFFRAGAFVA